MKRCPVDGGRGPSCSERSPLIGDHTPQGPFNDPEIRVRGQLTSEAAKTRGSADGCWTAFCGLI